MAELDIYAWSATASDNASADSAINWAEGQTPGSVNGSARGMMAALARYLKDNNGSLSTAGASNTYTIAAPNINYGAHATGLTICAKANHTNTATATLNVNNLGSKPIKIFTPSGETSLAAGQIQQNGVYHFSYDAAAASASGAWILQNPTSDATSQAQVGAIVPYGGSSAPSGWLLCYGQAISRTTYSALFAVFGTTFGAGDSSTTFNLPDLRGRALFGKDDMGGSAASRITNAGSSIVGTTLGATGGAESVTLTTNQIPSHTHTGTTSSNGAHTHGGATGSNGSHDHTGTTSSNGSHTHSGSTGSNGSHDHTGTTSGASADHTHTFSGTTSGVSVDHTHSGTTSASGSHGHTTSTDGSHTHTGTTDSGGVDHTHSYTKPSTNTFIAWVAGSGADSQTGSTTGGASAYLHTHTFTTASSGSHSHTTDTVAAHTHTITTGGASSDHTHTYSGTTSGHSADHTHTFTTSTVAAHTHTISADGDHTHTFTTSTAAAHTHTISSDGSHTHTFTSNATGGGLLHSNMPPAIILNFIVKY